MDSPAPQVGGTAEAIRQALTAEGFDREAYDELVTHDPAALTDRECGAVVAWALLGEVDRLTAALARERHEHGRTIDARDRASEAADALAYAIGTEEEIGEHTNLNDPWANALELLERQDKQATALSVLCADVDRAARGDREGRLPDAPRTDVLGALASVKALRTRAVAAEQERDDARDETRRLWDATEADRARMVALESRPTYEDGVEEGL